LDDTEARSALSLSEKEIKGLEVRLRGVHREVSHWQAREASVSQLIKNADEESMLNRELYEKKFISKPRLLQLDSQKYQSMVLIEENAAELSRARQKAVEIETAISAAKERYVVAKEKLARTVVASPRAGTVNGLRFSTLGGVVAPGGVLLEIVPIGEQLVVEARLSPDDIDVVKSGLAAKVRLSAYKARSHVSLQGYVDQVSSTTFRDENSQGRSFYKLIVMIHPDQLKEIDYGPLAIGMLAEVEILIGRRSVLRYLFDPVSDSMRRAFREE
jgi:HlyD family secretion protein/epimerase transport system membrane fusion protein